MSELEDFVAAAAAGLDVPGVAVGVLHEGEASYAFHGVTSVENPLPVDDVTLFQFGSTGKTFTSTALLRLVEQGQGLGRRPEVPVDHRVREVGAHRTA